MRYERHKYRYLYDLNLMTKTIGRLRKYFERGYTNVKKTCLKKRFGKRKTPKFHSICSLRKFNKYGYIDVKKSRLKTSRDADTGEFMCRIAINGRHYEFTSNSKYNDL